MFPGADERLYSSLGLGELPTLLLLLLFLFFYLHGLTI